MYFTTTIEFVRINVLEARTKDMSSSVLFYAVVFAFTLWLGFYLIARNPHKPVLGWTGAGLTAYALGLALEGLQSAAPDPEALERLRWPLLFAPGLLWFGASIYLLPEDVALRQRMDGKAGWWSAAVVLALLYGFSLLLDVRPGTAIYWLLFVLLVVMLIGALSFVWRAFRAAQHPRRVGILLTIALMFSLSVGLVLFPVHLLPSEWLLLALDLDMVLLGGCIAVLDAFDEGETLLPDVLHSLTISTLAVLVFGGQVVLAMSWSGQASFPLLCLLFAMIAVSIGAQVFSSGIQILVDRLVFARFGNLRRARADLRAAAEVLPRANDALDVLALDEEEFTRLTRRALSNLGNPARLSVSPLTRLPVIERRLAAYESPANTLDRAAELKALLVESIVRLKPRETEATGTSDAWRYYNALYYPYVLGLKPYNLNSLNEPVDAEARGVLEWFRASVPERTLHNWQNAAAKLVAQDLRERQS